MDKALDAFIKCDKRFYDAELQLEKAKTEYAEAEKEHGNVKETLMDAIEALADEVNQIEGAYEKNKG